MIIPRSIKEGISQRLRESDKIVIIYGPRQVGKTTLAKEILADWPGRVLELNADESRAVDVLSSRDSLQLGSLVAGYDLLFVDEAQRVPDIGLNLKILHDTHPDLRTIVTGSSPSIWPPLCRSPSPVAPGPITSTPSPTWNWPLLFPPFELDSQLPERLVYGSYPEVFSPPRQ